MALAGLAAVLASFDAFGAPATADPLQTAQARATELSDQALSQASVVQELSSRYKRDKAQAVFLGEQVTSSQRTVQSLVRRSDRTETDLRQEALLSYVDEVPADGSIGQLAGNLIELADQKTYLTLAVGDMTDTLDQFRLDQADLSTAIAARRTAFHEAVSAEKVASNQRALALDEAASLQELLSQARSQVAALAAAQHANAGPPVGNGVVTAVAQEIGTSADSGTGLSAVETLGQGASTASATTSTIPSTRTIAALSAATTTSVAPATTTTEVVTTTTAPPPATTTTTSPPPATTTTSPVPATSASSAGEPPPAGGVWLELRECESGDNYQEDTGNGFYGAYQFAAATWAGLGLPGLPNDAPYWVQDQAAERLQAQLGWGPSARV